MQNLNGFLRCVCARASIGAGIALALAGLLAAEEPRHVPTSEALSAITSKVTPQYPPLAKQINISGKVELEATIDEGGAVEAVTTLNGNPILAKAATDALKKWKFKPFKFDGKTAKVISNFTLEFRRYTEGADVTK